MHLIRRVLLVGMIAILLYSVLIVLRHPHKAYYESADTYVFSKGNAPEDVRAAIVRQLHKFQDGYIHRDTSLVQSFMEDLVSQDNIVMLGTQPHEVLSSYARATALVSADWRQWGDCRFLMDKAHVSSSGDVAWVATVGYVKCDMSRFLVLPLRLSAVMVKADGVWRIQYMQFQCDLECSPLLVTIVLLALWLAISVVCLTVATVRRVRQLGGNGENGHKGHDNSPRRSSWSS